MRLSSLSQRAIRVRALTLEYDSSPREKAKEIAGRVFGACATRTFSRAALKDRSQRQCSHSAQFAKPHFSQPAYSSKPRIKGQQFVARGVDAGGEMNDGAIEFGDGMMAVGGRFGRGHDTSLCAGEDL